MKIRLKSRYYKTLLNKIKYIGNRQGKHLIILRIIQFIISTHTQVFISMHILEKCYKDMYLNSM